MSMFDANNRIEGYLFDEQPDAYSTMTERKDIAKEEIMDKFVKITSNLNCTKITKEEDETALLYTATFNNRIPFEILIPKNSYEINKNLVEILESCLKTKKEIRTRRIKKDIGIVVVSLASIAALTGTVKLVRDGVSLKDSINNAMEKIVEYDNKKFDEQIAPSMEVKYERELENQENDIRNQYYDETNKQMR